MFSRESSPGISLPVFTSYIYHTQRLPKGNPKAICYTAHAHGVSILDPSVPCLPTLVFLGLLLKGRLVLIQD